jgi:hypothetical protein
MKKLIVLLLITLVCASSLYAIVGGGFMITQESLEDKSAEGEKKSFSFTAGTYWTEENIFKQKGFSASMLTEVGVHITFDDDFSKPRNGGNWNAHNDLSLALLAGAKYVPSDNTAIILSTGARLTRIGYYGIKKVEDIEGWDGLVSVISFGLLGGKPSRKLEILADLRFYFLYMGIGAQVGFPVWQNETHGYMDKMSMSVFFCIGNK